MRALLRLRGVGGRLAIHAPPPRGLPPCQNKVGTHIVMISPAQWLAWISPCRTLHPSPHGDRRMTRAPNWFATPCSCGSCIRYSSPAFTGAFSDPIWILHSQFVTRCQLRFQFRARPALRTNAFTSAWESKRAPAASNNEPTRSTKSNLGSGRAPASAGPGAMQRTDRTDCSVPGNKNLAGKTKT
jgi:hypothetical protein